MDHDNHGNIVKARKSKDARGVGMRLGKRTRDKARPTSETAEKPVEMEALDWVEGERLHLLAKADSMEREEEEEES